MSTHKKKELIKMLQDKSLKEVVQFCIRKKVEFNDLPTEVQKKFSQECLSGASVM